MRLLREYINTLLKETAMGFVHDLAAATQEGEFGEDFMGGKIGKPGGRAIKRAFEANADHQWLSTIDTVHWTDGYGLKRLTSGKDELSATMSLPGGKLDPHGRSGEVGLWIKGRITLASNNQDTMFTGTWRDYMGALGDGTPEEADADHHRTKSSGINKRPTVSKDYSRYDKLEPGNEYAEKMARNIPYVLDQSTWNPEGEFQPNEALVDNWTPVGIVVVEDSAGSRIKAVKHHAQNPSGAIGMVKEILQAAAKLGVPLYDIDRNELWSPGEKEITEAVVRRYIRKILTEAALDVDDLGEKVIVLQDRGDTFSVTLHAKKIEGEKPFYYNKDMLGIFEARLFGGCAGAYEVRWAEAPKGWGPLLYDVGMEYATMKGGGLVSDRSSVTPPAAHVWDYYYNNRRDIDYEQLDDHAGHLTPGDESDDCDQTIVYSGQHDSKGQSWDDIDGDDESWEKTGKDILMRSPLSKVYRWGGYSVIDDLRRQGKLVML